MLAFAKIELLVFYVGKNLVPIIERFDIDGPDRSVSHLSQSSDEMPTDESACSRNQYAFFAIIHGWFQAQIRRLVLLT